MMEQVGSVVGLVALVAVVASVVLEVIKGLLPTDVPTFAVKIAVAVLSIYMTVVARIDLLSAFGLNLPFYFSTVVTGLIASTGSKGVYDFAKRAFGAKNGEEAA